MRRQFSIRSKLFAAILLTLVVSHLFLFYVTITSSTSSLNKEIDKDLEANLRFAKSQYLGQADLIRNSLALPISAQPVRERILARDRLWLADALRRWHHALPFTDLLSIVDSSGRVIVRLNGQSGDDQFRPAALLQLAHSRRAPLVTTELISRDDFCREGDAAVCASIPPDGDLMMITVVMPVIAADDSFLGWVVVGNALNKDTRLPYQIQKVFGKEVAVAITQRGALIASSSEALGTRTGRLSTKILNRLQSGYTYHGSTTFGNRSFEMVAEPLTNSNGTFIGSLAVALTRENYLNIHQDSIRTTLISGVFGIFLSFAIAYSAARRFTTPLLELNRKAEEIQAGDFTQRVTVASNDELGQLADSFNRMAKAVAERDATIRKKNEALEELNEVLEKRVAERTAQLRMEMEMMEAILTSMVDGVVVTNRKNHIAHINPAAQKIFGVAAEDILGLPIDQACRRGDFCALVEQIREFSAESVRVLELPIGGKDLKISIAPLLDEGGFYSGLVMSIRDVTLEGEVNRMKSAFISTMSHELKTPLTSMKGSLQVILNKGKWLTGTERELLGVCLRNTDRLIRMINSILEISKIESGNVEFSMKPIPVNELLIYAIEEQKGFALSRNISLVNTAASDLPMVLGMRDRLIQVLANLISNAVKFSPAGTVVMISAQRDGEFIAISVADHGRSISPDDRSKLFTKFQQFPTTEESGIGGTGLGLAICKEIVEKHGGLISYQPGLAGGNVFTFTVPIFEESHGQKQDSHR